ncbi:MAG: hypothetical protein LBJ19_02445 [Holosporaceae bacterium]|jgi:hypothetical protein|nr:hypothetical protein [Holosporaceae bacterium]
MSIVRSIRFLSDGYLRNFGNVPDTEENIVTTVALEMPDDGGICPIKLNEEWPTSIILDASMHPAKIKQHTVLIRQEDNVSLGKNSIYENPHFDSCSTFKNNRLFCSKILILFEKTGEYFCDGQSQSFMDEFFGEYFFVPSNTASVIADSSRNKKVVLFEKKFPTAESGDIIEKYTRGSGASKFLQMEGISGRAPYHFYAYGGFYEYGTHPQNMESCVFHSTAEGRASCIYLSKLSGLKKLGIDPDSKVNMLNDARAIFMHTFTISQKMTLYEELKNGGCKIQLTNNCSGRSRTYGSSGLIHTPGTNLIRINFIALD